MTTVAEQTLSRDHLERLFEQYRSSNVQNQSPKAFTDHLQSLIGVVDENSEPFEQYELARQRDLSIKFHWGHNHDFGDFQLAGRMGNRHFDLMHNFLTEFSLGSDFFKNKSVLDVGCWTGGTTLLLAAMNGNASIVAIEEVKKYADTTDFLVNSFNLNDRVDVRPNSIYDCNQQDFAERFDVVYFPGVVYHLSDPVLALRILFNSLKVGGSILVESMGINTDQPVCEFAGNDIYRDQEDECEKDLNRGGWNWFVPSPLALKRMMLEAGFENVHSLWHDVADRVYAYGEKRVDRGICKAGLSVTDIR